MIYKREGLYESDIVLRSIKIRYENAIRDANSCITRGGDIQDWIDFLNRIKAGLECHVEPSIPVVIEKIEEMINKLTQIRNYLYGVAKLTIKNAEIMKETQEEAAKKASGLNNTYKGW